MLTEEAKTIGEITKRERVTRYLIAHRIQPAYQASDIMRRTIAGDIPDTLNLEAFKNRRIPLDWQEQRRYFELAGLKIHGGVDQPTGRDFKLPAGARVASCGEDEALFRIQ